MKPATLLLTPACLALLVSFPGALPAQNLPRSAANTPQPAPVPAPPPSPSQLYLQGHLLMKEGTEKEGKGDFAGAYFKFKDARDMFDSAGEADRTWQPEIVEYRRRKIREEMERVRQLEIKRRADGGAPSPSGVIGEASAPRNLSIAPALPGSTGTGRNTPTVIEERLRGMQAQIDSLTKRNEEVVKKLGAREEELRSARAEILNAKSAETALRQSLADAQTKLETAEPAARRKNEALTKRVEQLEKQLADALGQLSASNAKSDSLLAELEKAYSEIQERTRERDEMQKERDQMEALLTSGEGGRVPDKARIIAENQRLKKELEAAKTNVERLTAEKAADQNEIASLRGQLSSVQHELTRLQQESEDYRTQIRALTERLDATDRLLGEAGQGAVPEIEATMENKVLRQIILQQMKQQVKREAARQNIMEDLLKEGVLDSMKNLGVETERVLRTLNEMASTTQLTREQRGVLSNTNLDSFLMKNGVGDLMMTQDSQALREAAGAGASGTTAEGPPPGETRSKDQLSPELKAYANAAEEQFRMGSFSEAENQYRKILMIEPMNVHALSNLGVVQVNQGNLTEAEKNIKKALAYDYDNGPAHFLLGVVYMRQKQMDDAVEEITTGLKLDPGNANAHLTLGLIAHNRGRLGEAERAYKAAIAADSACAQAHFNLSVLYAKEMKIDLARQHYRNARRHGHDRDQNMDKFLEN